MGDANVGGILSPEGKHPFKRCKSLHINILLNADFRRNYYQGKNHLSRELNLKYGHSSPIPVSFMRTR